MSAQRQVAAMFAALAVAANIAACTSFGGEWRAQASRQVLRPAQLQVQARAELQVRARAVAWPSSFSI